MSYPTPPQIPPDVADVHEQIAALREKVDELMNGRVKPAVATVADGAEALAHRATDKLGQLSACIRERPLLSVAATFVSGYILAALRRG